MIKYGYQTNSWTFAGAKGMSEIMRAVADPTPLKQAIENLSALEFDGIELMAIGDWKGSIVRGWGDTAKFSRMLKGKGLALASTYWMGPIHVRSERESIVASAEDAAKFLHACGSSILVVGPPWRSEVPKVERKHLEAIAGSLNAVGKKIAEYGVQPTIHPHYNTMVETFEETKVVMELTDPDLVWLCPDTAQYYVSGEDPVECIKALKDRTNYWHFKDAKERAIRSISFAMKRYFYELGAGRVDFPAVMQIVREMKFEGWISVECDGTPNPAESAKTNKRYIDEVLRKIYG